MNQEGSAVVRKPDTGTASLKIYIALSFFNISIIQHVTKFADWNKPEHPLPGSLCLLKSAILIPHI
jgi:hypothetical protein